MRQVVATTANRIFRLWWRITKPVTFGVRGVILDSGGRVLLVRHTYVRGWYLPGGGRQRLEEPKAALAREVREEVGIADLRIDRRLGTYVNLREGKRDTVEVFVAYAETTGRLQRREIVGCEWFDPCHVPADVSPGTARRIAEFLGEATIAGTW